jgi:hypothetical protein
VAQRARSAVNAMLSQGHSVRARRTPKRRVASRTLCEPRDQVVDCRACCARGHRAACAQTRNEKGDLFVRKADAMVAHEPNGTIGLAGPQWRHWCTAGPLWLAR